MAISLFLILLAFATFLGIGVGWFGAHDGAGKVTQIAVPHDTLAGRTARRSAAAAEVGARASKQILFGDLHVHSTFSYDAFLMALPMMQGEGAHPVSDACDFARYCSALDFWSINDHAETSTPRHWRETIETIRQCNAVAGDPANPDITAFLGWEWTQASPARNKHYGHKNIVLAHTDEARIPARPISADPAGMEIATLPTVLELASRAIGRPSARHLDLARYVRELKATNACPSGVGTRDLPIDCRESAATPGELFRKLDEWGYDALVIPHGTTWGLDTPRGVTWDQQLTASENDPDRQILIEVYSGHGNSEEYRDWRAVDYDENGSPFCPAPVKGYKANCWRAGEIIEARCRAVAESSTECEARAAEARQNYLAAGFASRHVVPGSSVEDWLDSGQCRDCFMPALNLRPGGSAQYITALSSFDENGEPKRFRFGFIASSDNHSARPGTGYKEFARLAMTDTSGGIDEDYKGFWKAPPRDPLPQSEPFDFKKSGLTPLETLEIERTNSIMATGGLVAVHAAGRGRAAIWSGLLDKETYGTSGGKTLLWFDLVNGPEGGVAPMGSVLEMDRTPQFEVRAVGALKQKPGCPDYALSALSPDRVAKLCHDECFNPSDERKLITRIEVIRIRPQSRPGEPVAGLIEDPWRVFSCAPDQGGCAVVFDDPEFAAAGRDTAYYVRAIEEPSEAIGGAGLRCRYDENGDCIEVDPCYGDYRTSGSDNCLATVEERAWSSPIYVDYGQAG